MPMSRNKKIVITTAIAVATLQAATHFLDQLWLLGPLMPGIMVGLLITGGHGGTHMQDRIAIVLSFGVNTIVYTLVGVAIASVFQTIRRKSAE
jgi:hypothetical protein